MSRSSTRVASVASLNESAAPTVYDRNLHRRRNEVSFSAFAYVFSEAIQYCNRQARDVSDLETRLNRMGQHIGMRALELVVLREGKSAKRETKVLQIIQFVTTNLWRALFGKAADSVQVSTEEKNQYMVVDNDPLVTKFVSVPKDMSSLNCGALVAGVMQGAFSSAGFPCTVTAHNHETEETPDRTVFVVKFQSDVELS